MRVIKFIVLHCTATSQDAKVESIQRYWKEALKWNSPGYHYLIEPSGNINNLLSEDKIANGVAGKNSISIHISYIGGVDNKGKAVDNRTPQQILSQLELLNRLIVKYPSAKIAGHNQFSSKACPSFDTVKWLESQGFAFEKIYR